ncbi:MAG TPA: hypothetical protein VF859_10860, partial [Burkholderiales bacterium]
MSHAVLVVNAGSSSIKFAVFASTPQYDLNGLLYKGLVERIDGGHGRFSAGNAQGERLAAEDIAAPAGGRLDHQRMLAVALDWLEG